MTSSNPLVVSWVPVKTARCCENFHQQKKPALERPIQLAKTKVLSCTFLCFPGSIETWRGESDFFPKINKTGVWTNFPICGKFFGGPVPWGHPEAYIISFTFLNLIQAVLVHSTSVRNQRSKTVKSPPPPPPAKGGGTCRVGEDFQRFFFIYVLFCCWGGEVRNSCLVEFW